MRRRLLPLLALAVLAATAARAQQALELPWTRVVKADLERFESGAGNVRVNNLVVERQKDSDPAGPATQFEFSASVANRSPEHVRVYLQIVGLKADGTPSLSCDTYVDVDSRRNESVRETFRANPAATDETSTYFVRAVTVP
jgi:hypothetical protein